MGGLCAKCAVSKVGAGLHCAEDTFTFAVHALGRPSCYSHVIGSALGAAAWVTHPQLLQLFPTSASCSSVQQSLWSEGRPPRYAVPQLTVCWQQHQALQSSAPVQACDPLQQSNLGSSDIPGCSSSCLRRLGSSCCCRCRLRCGLRGLRRCGDGGCGGFRGYGLRGGGDGGGGGCGSWRAAAVAIGGGEGVDDWPL